MTALEALLLLDLVIVASFVTVLHPWPQDTVFGRIWLALRDRVDWILTRVPGLR